MQLCQSPKFFRKILFLAFSFGAICTLSVSEIKAADVYDLPKVVAVQKRKYMLNDEVAPQISYLPLDALYKYMAVGATYTHYFSDFVGWEVVNGNLAFKQSSDLLDTIKAAQFDIANKIHVLEYYGSTNLVYTPLYSKSLLFSRSIVYGETSFVFGPAYGKFEEGSKIGINLGFILRYYLGTSTSLKFDARDYFFMGGESINSIMLTVGLAINLGSAPRTSSEFDEE